MTNWLGTEWESYCLSLLRRQYGLENVQVVPSRHGGDLGIEAFTFTGIAIQCYAPISETTAQDRYEKQRDKLTEDLCKLEKYRIELAEILGNAPIRHYLFMVPALDSRKIVKHAQRKSREYRAKNLSFLDDSFTVTVVTDEAFSDVRGQVTKEDIALAGLHRTGAVLVADLNDIDPIRNCRIHPSLRSEDKSPLPPYVARTIDSNLDQAIKQGGFVIVEGNSASGKSRTAFEALKRFRDTWQSIVIPRDGNALRRYVESGGRLRRAAIWLDDLERFLTPDGLDDSLIGAIARAEGNKVLILATLRAQAKSALYMSGGLPQSSNVVIGAQRAIEASTTVRLGRHLDKSEIATARRLTSDSRVAAALHNETGAGFAEYLAAGPAAVDRWLSGLHGGCELGASLVSAAVDIRLAGYISPVPRVWLEQAFSAYLDPRLLARTTRIDLDEALQWATEEVQGASSCLIPCGDETYIAFDYLLEHRQGNSEAVTTEDDPTGFTSTLSIFKEIPEQIWHEVLCQMSIDDPHFFGCACIGILAGHPILQILMRQWAKKGQLPDVSELQIVSLVRTCLAINFCVACMATMLELDITRVLVELVQALPHRNTEDALDLDSRTVDTLLALAAFAKDGRPDQEGTAVQQASKSISSMEIRAFATDMTEVGLTLGGYIWMRVAASRGTSRLGQWLINCLHQKDSMT
ncbi:hypothetical protein ACFQHO_34150 [Actinomadura yumaensis]|uniref:hypothetical protein n=1 Tax=Actinomadura yumaensis TaxID=111807 RepID=UPI003609E472